MISLDLVTANSMVVDTNLKKRLRAANGALMKFSGSVVLRCLMVMLTFLNIK